MKWNPSSLDGEIQAVERCIAADRQLLEQAFVGYVDGVRDSAVRTIASPKFLLGALGVGFVVGKFLFRPRSQARQEDAPVAKKSVLGLLGAGALSLVQAQFGGPVGLARWLTAKAYEHRRAAQRPDASWEEPMPGSTAGAYVEPRPASMPGAHAAPGSVATPADPHPASLLRR